MAAAHWNESSDQLPRTGRKRIADDNHRGNETVHLRSPPQSLFVSLKMMTSQCCTVFIYTIVVLSTVHHSLAYNNVSSSGEELLHRMKRFLIFNNGGIVKVQNTATIEYNHLQWIINSPPIITERYGNSLPRPIRRQLQTESQFSVQLPVPICAASRSDQHLQSALFHRTHQAKQP